MNWYKIAQSGSFQDWFKEDLEKWKGVKEVKRDNPVVANIALVLYRGFDADLNNIKKSGNDYVLSPRKSEQGFLWFTQYRNIAKGRGKYILEYPLEVKKHIQKVYYSNGSESDATPQEILEKNNPTENCRFYGSVELPEGWFFSYKTEKHIICAVDIVVSRDMIKENIIENY